MKVIGSTRPMIEGLGLINCSGIEMNERMEIAH